MPTRRVLLSLLPLLLALAACSTADASTPGEADPNEAAPSAVSPEPGVIDAPTAVDLLASRDDLTIIDVRTPAEYASGNLAGSQMIDIQAGDFQDRIAELDPDGAYVVYCRTGNRSAVAVSMMEQLGFVELYDAGGFDDLAAAGADVTD